MKAAVLRQLGRLEIEDVELDGGEGQSLQGIEGAGEASGGSINKHSIAVSDINNHANLAEVLSEVYVCNSARLDEVLEHLNVDALRPCSDLPFLDVTLY